MGSVMLFVLVAREPTRLHTVAKWPLSAQESRKLKKVRTDEVICLLDRLGLRLLICGTWEINKQKYTKNELTEKTKIPKI